MKNESFIDFFTGIVCEPEEIAADLDNKWMEACSNGRFDLYEKHKDSIKCTGAKVYRNSAGKHKVVK